MLGESHGSHESVAIEPGAEHEAHAAAPSAFDGDAQHGSQLTRRGFLQSALAAATLAQAPQALAQPKPAPVAATLAPTDAPPQAPIAGSRAASAAPRAARPPQTPWARRHVLHAPRPAR